MFENATIEEGGATIALHIPMQFKRRGGRKEIILPPRRSHGKAADAALQLAVARAYHWQAMLDSGEVASLGDIAIQVDIDKSYLSKILRFTLLAPDIVEAK